MTRMTQKQPNQLPLQDLRCCLGLAARLIWFPHNTRHPHDERSGELPKSHSIVSSG